MPVVLVHYHLRPGGVTRVLETQSEALTRAGLQHVILSGTPYEGPCFLPVVVVPGLAYRGKGSDDEAQGEALFEGVRRAARTALQCEPSCWHVHNPTLGKNALFPGLIARLAELRIPLVLHVHDFAEEGRPLNYQALRSENQLYPIAPQIRYTVITSRARKLLVSAGVPADQCTLLPNAVDPSFLPTGSHSPAGALTGPLVLYPVRGIRRKNLGEFCLLASLAPQGSAFALSLQPENPQAKPDYDRWVDVGGELDLPLSLGVVGTSPPCPEAGSSYGDWIKHATHLMTTSVSEGFGLTFLEALALGKPLIGRDLPEITSDFATPPGSLYQKLLIPSAWVNELLLREHLRNALQRSYRCYGAAVPEQLPEQVHTRLEHFHGGAGYLDFGNLPEELQADVIRKTRKSPEEVLVAEGEDIRPARAWLSEALEKRTTPEASSTLAAYSIDQYARRHETLYRSLEAATPVPARWLDKRRILALFLRPEHFHFLRT